MRLHTNKFCGTVVLCFLLLSFCHSHAQGIFQWTVRFDGSPHIAPGSNIGVTYYEDQGMIFKPIEANDQFTRAGGGVSFFPENGTAYILNGFGDSFSGIGLSPRFRLVSVDLSEFSTLYPFPRAVQFLGYKPDGTIVETVFVTDGIIDGTGPLPDFQTFYFDQRFGDLIRFEVPGYRYALDNMVFAFPVPEPDADVLMILGVAVLGFRFFLQHSRTAQRCAPARRRIVGLRTAPQAQAGLWLARQN